MFSGRKLLAPICCRPAFLQASVAAFSAADPTVAGAAADAQPVAAAGLAVAQAAEAEAAALAEAAVVAVVAAPAAVVVAVGAAEPVAELGGQSLAAAEAARLSQDRPARRRHPARDVPAALPVPNCPAVLWLTDPNAVATGSYSPAVSVVASY